MAEELDSLVKLKADIKHFDPHVRQNAVIAYGKYIENDKERMKLKPEQKTDIINHLLDCLEPKETSIEVKGRTVKVFSKIAIHLNAAETEQVFSKIIKNITKKPEEGKDEGKEIYVGCLKSIIQKIPDSFAEMIGKVILPVLSKTLDCGDPNMIYLCIDTLNEYIDKFGYTLSKMDHKNLKEKLGLEKSKYVNTVLKYINSKDDRLKTSSVAFLGTLGQILKKSETEKVTELLISKFSKAQDMKEKMQCILSINSLARVAAHKQKELFKNIIPLLEIFISTSFLNDSKYEYDEKNSMTQVCLNCLEIYINTSLRDMKEFMDKIIKYTIQLVDFDPGYHYDEGNENAGLDADYDMEGYGEYEIEEDATVEDSSWRVRIEAAKVLASIQKSGHKMERTDRENILSKLVMCLREHEENTKLEIIGTLGLFLDGLLVEREDENELIIKNASSVVEEFIPKIGGDLINSILMQLKAANKNEKIKSKLLELLPIIAKVSTGVILLNFNKLTVGIEENNAFNSNENTMIIMRFLNKIFKNMTYDPEYRGYIPKFINYIEKGLNNNYYKVKAYAIKNISRMFTVLAILDLDANKDYVNQLYKLVLPFFKAQDIDSDIKIVSVTAIAYYIIECKELIDEKTLDEIFVTYVSKASNDLLKANILSALYTIIDSEKNKKLCKPIERLKPMILDILKSAPSHIQIKVLNLLEIIYKNYPDSLSKSTKEIIIKIKEMTNQEGILSHIYKAFYQMLPSLDQKSILSLIKHVEEKIPDVDVGQNKALLEPIFSFTKNAIKKLDKNDLKELVQNYFAKLTKLKDTQSYLASIVICHSGNEKVFIDHVFKAITSINEDNELSNILAFIGNLCENSSEKHSDLISKLESFKANSKPNIRAIIDSSIGQIGVNIPDDFIQLLKATKSFSNLISLNEFLNIINERGIPLKENYIFDLITYLLSYTQLDKDDINQLVGGCIGKAISTQPNLNSQFLDLFNNKNEFQISVLILGTKFLFKEKKERTFKRKESGLKGTELKIISTVISFLLKNSKNRFVKQNALTSILAFISRYPSQIETLLDKNNLFSIIEECSQKDENFINTVDFGGANKIIEDKGIQIRKTAFEILNEAIKNYPNRLNFNATLNLLINGITDDDENVRNIVFISIHELATIYPSSFVPVTEPLCDQLIKCFREKVKLLSSKQEYSKNVKKICDELAGEQTISENKKFIDIQKTVTRIVEEGK